METSEKNGDNCGHRLQEVSSLQALTKRVTLRFNVMATTPLQDQWRCFARRRGLRIEAPFAVKVQGETITVPVLLRDFGADRGMLLVTDWDLISRYADSLVELGFGYSCLFEPDEEYRSGERGDDAGLLACLADWGWSGDGPAPSWYREATR